nr:MAG TPA: hypothetical protein [Bacteriophage sp.]
MHGLIFANAAGKKHRPRNHKRERSCCNQR